MEWITTMMNDTQPLISVIIPTYNRATVLHKSIESVLNQTYTKFELIIVDDGSSDNTKEVVGGYEDDRIRYVYNSSNNHGPSQARNIGIDASKGMFIAFNDSDDKWLENKLEKQMEFMYKTKADISFCSMYKDRKYIPPNDFKESECVLEKALAGSFTGTPAYLGKAECFKKNLFDEKLRCNEDWELMIRLLNKYKVYFQRNSLVEVTVSENSVGSDIYKAIGSIDYILKKHSDLYNRYPMSKKRLLVGKRYAVALLKDLEAQERVVNNKGVVTAYIKAIFRRVVRYGYSIRMLLEDKSCKS